MRDRSRRGTVSAVLVVALAGAGCSTNPAPRGWLPRAEDVGRDVRGGWVEVEYEKAGKHDTAGKNEKSGNDEKGTRGELIAVEERRLHVLTARGLETVPVARIKSARVRGWDHRTGELAAWAGIGTVSTLSHGAFLVFTAPVLWLAGGFGSVIVESAAPDVEYPDKPIGALSRYARFPQGLPDGLDPSSLGRLATAPPPRAAPAR